MMPLWSGKQIMPLTDVWQGFKIAQMSDLGDVGRLVNKRHPAKDSRYQTPICQKLKYFSVLDWLKKFRYAESFYWIFNQIHIR